ncbi:MIF-like protein mif-2 [Portunus trituberculatus]|uniref:MIF-like protein mif-2 n=1 Tax=Portunus trituberculatus TaxID=210409 RepID=UPI001E1CE05E|nr:MIF-like protein mif-2 [Portunus trituberculatus]
MPLVTLITNLPDHKLSEDFHLALSSKLAEALGKPEERVSVRLQCGQRMARGGSMAPVCELHVASIGLEGRDKTQPLAEVMTDFLANSTGIPPKRILMSFSALQPHNIGCEGKLMG